MPNRDRRAVTTTPESAEKQKVKADRAATTARKKAMLTALAICKGNVSKACKRAGITRACHYLWAKEDPGYRERCGDMAERLVDDIETLFVQSMINADDRQSMRWYLERQAGTRGYGKSETTKHVVSGPDDGPIQVNGSMTVAVLRGIVPDKALRSAMRDLVAQYPELLLDDEALERHRQRSGANSSSN